ncbi:MAG TPA: phosphatidate cytidylyltransferase [Nitrospiria bacterium]|nr:phosphatidate cytidylyltransferase [Nitrospiria bacterium]
MHQKRVISAVLFLPLFFILVKYLPPAAFFIVVLFGVLLGQLEFYRLYFPAGKRGLILFGLLCGGLIVGHFYEQGFFSDREVLTALGMAGLLYQLATYQDMATTLGDTAVAALGVFYVGWLLGHLILLRGLEQGEYLIFFLFLVTWAGDTGAYYIGKGFGRRPLAPRLSPGKTVEGAVGGLAASILAAVLARQWFLPFLSVYDGLFLGLLLGVLGQMGDLTESMFKRSAGVKDSGHFLPGHGGILDKMDSLIFTTPLFYYYLLWVKQYGRVIVI